jgi:hypothetical protein
LLSFWVSLFWFVYHPDRHFHSLPNGPFFGVRLISTVILNTIDDATSSY